LTAVNRGIQTKPFKLTTGTYTFTVKTVDSTGNKSGGVTETATVTIDTVIPVLSSVSATYYTLTADGTTATLTFTADEPGTYYAVVYFTATSAPANAAALKTAYDAGVTGDTKAVLSGTAAAGVNTAGISGLTKGASHIVHITMADAALNYAAVKSTYSFVPTKVYTAEVTGISATPGVLSITLNWTNPADVDFKRVRIYSSGIGTYLISTNTYTFTGLNENTSYTFTIRTEDTDGNVSAGVAYSANPVTPLAPEDTTPPGEVTGISHTLGSTNSGEITISWTNPNDADFKQAMVSVGSTTYLRSGPWKQRHLHGYRTYNRGNMHHRYQDRRHNRQCQRRCNVWHGNGAVRKPEKADGGKSLSQNHALKRMVLGQVPSAW
jgi:hypothetical protein